MRRFHISILIITLASLATWFYTYNKISPFSNGQINLRALALFLGTLGIGITGVYTLITYPIKHIFGPHADPRQQTRASLRQGLLLAGGVVFLIFLSISHILNYITAGLTVLVVILLELFFR